MIEAPQTTVLIETILSAGVWQSGDFQFASGKRADNKLDMEALLDHPEQLDVILGALGQLALMDGFRPDAIVGVPNGAQKFAGLLLAERLNIPWIRLRKDSMEPGRKTFQYESPEDSAQARQADRILIVEDTTTELTSIAGTLAVEPPLLGARVKRGIAIWRRGLPEAEQPIDVPFSWLVEQPLSNMLNRDSAFFKHYGHFLVAAGKEEAA